MGAAENNNADERAPSIEIPLDRFDRLLLLLERVAQAQERLLGQDQDNARRAAKKVGPTTPQAEARVAARLRRIRGSK